MSPSVIAGILLAIFGAVILIRGLDMGSQRSVIAVGDVQASIQTRRSVPLWVGGAALAGGVVLIGTGLQRRRRGA